MKTDSRIFDCIHCGETLDLSTLCIKGYEPIKEQWAHYNTVTNKNCKGENHEKNNQD